MRATRILLWSAGAILLLALCAAGVLHWASRSETLLRWGVERLATRLPCSLSVDGLRGTFMEPVHVQRVVCESAAFRVEARDVSLVWSPWMLTQRRLEVASLQADTVMFSSKAGESAPLRAPADLSIPVEVDMTAIEIGTISITSATESVELRDVSASYRGGMRSHRLTLRRLGTEWGRIEGDATVGASAPLPIAARLTVSSHRFESWPLSAAIEFSGELRRMTATVRGVAGPLAVAGEVVVAPFDPDPIVSVAARASGVDVAMLDSQFPRTAFAVELTARGHGLDAVSGTLRAENAEPGRLDQRRLPVQALKTDFAADAKSLRLTGAELDLGPAGLASGSAEIASDRIALFLDVRNLDLKAVHGSLRSTRLHGPVRVDSQHDRRLVGLDLRQDDMRIEGEAEVTPERVKVERLLVRAGGAQARATGIVGLGNDLEYALDASLEDFDPARFGDFPEARISGTVKARGSVRPNWNAEVKYRLGSSRLTGIPLGGSGRFRVSRSRLRDADIHLNVGGNDLKLTGSFGAPGDALVFSVDARRLDRLDRRAAGRLQASGALIGTLSRPAVSADLQGQGIGFEQYRVGEVTAKLSVEQGDDPKLQGHAIFKRIAHGELALDAVEVGIDGSRAAHGIDVAVDASDLHVAGRLDGGWDASRRLWSGVVARLENRGEYAFTMLRPVTLELALDHVLIGATAVQFSNTELTLGETRYRDGELLSKGAIKGVRASRLFGLMEKPPAVESTLVLGGRWEIRARDAVDGVVEFTRMSGDIVIPGEEPLELGLKELRLTLRAVASQVTAEASLLGNGIEARGMAQTRIERRGMKWGVPGTAPMSLEGRLAMQSIRPLAALASRSVTADGSLRLTVKGDGTVAKPRLSGSVEGDGLKVEHVANGVFLREGTLRAQFGDDAVTVTAFSIKGGQGTLNARGRFTARSGLPAIDLQWTASKLTVAQHPDLRLTVSGAGKLEFDDSRFALRGELTADQGRVELRSGTVPSIGDDVVVSGRETRSQVVAETKRADLDLKLDLGPDFIVVGRGLNARVAGQIRLTSARDKPLAANGEIRVASGTYEAYGRRLQIEKGVLYFSGPVDNPGVSILALRKNQPVEAGVEVTGTARDPRVRLVSNPDVPDPEKLSWLVLGRKVESGNTADAQTLQASAMALAAGLGTMPLQQQLARAVGLDEITFMAGDSTSQGGMVAVGKRISDKVYVTHERSLSTATNTLRVSYQLSRRWSLRTESGQTDAVDLFFTISFD